MAWTWQEITDGWLGGSGGIAASNEGIVAAFELVDELVGREWLESQRTLASGGQYIGTGPVASAVAMGRKLQRLRKSPGLAEVLAKIRIHDAAASAELTAAYLCVASDPSVLVEFGVPVLVGSHPKVPDFRLQESNGTFIYVEVTAPERSELEQRVQEVLGQLGTALEDMPLGSAAEVMVRRDPADVEVNEIRQALLEQAHIPGETRRDLPGLALILTGHYKGGQIVVDDHGEPHLPRIACFKAQGLGNARKDLLVRHVVSDERAERFLRSEARQLSSEVPGIVMVGVSRAPGAFGGWKPLLERRMQPGQHTRVSAVVLFESGLYPLPDGEGWVARTNVIANPHALNPAPAWLLEQLESWEYPSAGGDENGQG